LIQLTLNKGVWELCCGAPNAINLKLGISLLFFSFGRTRVIFKIVRIFYYPLLSALKTSL